MTRYEFAEAIHKKYMQNEKLTERERLECYDALFHTGVKLIEYFSKHDRILVSVSGGSDSDCVVHLICSYFPEYIEKCHFVFVDTGLEYDATKRHLHDIEKQYQIEIKRIRGKSVVWAVKKYGVPILNKTKSKGLSMYLRNTPKGHYIVFERPGSMYSFTENERALARYLKENGIMVSQKCCDVAKKDPIHAYIKENQCDLNVTGVRKGEGGARATSYKGCFQPGAPDTYMPLYWWSNKVKEIFKLVEGIKYSDCYEVWGMKRTGCVGCPFGKDTAEELRMMKKYEPKLFNAVMHTFGEAYRLTDEFNCRKKKKLPDDLLDIPGKT